MIDESNVFIIVIDFQERMLPHIKNGSRVVKNTVKLLKAAGVFGIPIIATKQVKLGETAEEIEKDTFSCYASREFVENVEKIGRKKCIIAGIESHICVIQTALQMLEDGYEVYIATDCMASRNEMDHEMAIGRMIQEGVKPSTSEAIIYEIMKSASHEKFREILKIVKEG
ncbi:MAG TPA: hydrolase [Thermoplasmatales archaeon]|nr:hydrolase [Thermoplasmatales archaeon]